MRYMMFVVVDPDAAAEAEPSEDELTIEEWLADVDGRGKRITGDALRPVSDATTVRISRGQVLVRLDQAQLGRDRLPERRGPGRFLRRHHGRDGDLPQ